MKMEKMVRTYSTIIRTSDAKLEIWGPEWGQPLAKLLGALVPDFNNVFIGRRVQPNE
jgi:hypothetical protein